VIAHEGDQQQPSQIWAEQPLKTLGDRGSLFEITAGRTVSQQKAGSAAERAAGRCGGHVKGIAIAPSRLHP
jgi:hypothetical protein